MPITIKRKDTGQIQLVDMDTFRTQYNASLYDIIKRESIVEMYYFNSNWGKWVSPTLTERSNAEKWVNEQPNSYKFEPVPDFDNNITQSESVLERRKYEQTASDMILESIREAAYVRLAEKRPINPPIIEAPTHPIKTSHSEIGSLKKWFKNISLKNIIEMIIAALIAGVILALVIYWYHLNAVRS